MRGRVGEVGKIWGESDGVEAILGEDKIIVKRAGRLEGGKNVPCDKGQ